MKKSDPCEALKKWREIAGPILDRPIIEPPPPLDQGIVRDRPAREQLLEMCQCLQPAFSNIVQAQTRPATGRGLTSIQQFFPVLIGGVEQILPADPTRRLIVITNNPVLTFYSPSPVNLDVFAGFVFPANKSDPLVITEEVYGAWVQSAWFANAAAAWAGPSIIITESYLGGIGEKKIWQGLGASDVLQLLAPELSENTDETPSTNPPRYRDGQLIIDESEAY